MYLPAELCHRDLLAASAVGTGTFAAMLGLLKAYQLWALMRVSAMEADGIVRLSEDEIML